MRRPVFSKDIDQSVTVSRKWAHGRFDSAFHLGLSDVKRRLDLERLVLNLIAAFSQIVRSKTAGRRVAA